MQGGRVLVIGNGGREHAICWKLAQSPKVKDIFVAGNNVGIVAEPKVQKAALDLKDFKGVASWCKQNNIELVVVGPEDPLANGIADVLTSEGLLCFGPKKAAAQIEASKEFAKNFMDKYSIPTAKWKSFTSAKEAKEFIRSGCFPSVVVKASGLAAGKGVIVASSAQEAEEAVDSILVDSKFGAAGETVVIEEFLKGDEVSVLAFTDGSNVKLMVPAQDHKRILDDDQGLNTGGMGAYAPCPLLTENTLRLIEETVLQRAVLGLKKDNTPFVGVLYAGLMLTSDGPKVLEFNCRFGDPETQVILPLLESDLYDIIKACCTGNLCSCDLKWKAATSAVGVVLSSAGYPETSTKGKVIKGLDEVSKLRGHYVFHSGTDIVNGNVVTNGGRVLIAVVLSPTLILAAAKAQLACKKISFEGAHYRKDIAFKGIARSLLHEGELTYQKSGVDITAADNLIHNVKPAIESTKRSGVVGSVGGFGGLFDVKASGYTDPLLVSGTDGVGTKLKIAETCGIHSTLGIDLVAMCVNDILTHGAEPLYFLDYYACGALSVDVASQVITGVAKGCKEAGCALIGGETAEMPGIYSGGEYDLAGFAVGAVERSNLLPLTNKIKPGDVLIGLPSSGVHSNGFSLVRRILEKSGKKYSDKAPFSKTGKTFGEELLTPTKIYVKNLIGILKTGKVKALAHITGGGLLENVPRILPKGVRAVFDATQWQILPVYGWLAAVGGVTAKEMLRTFNCGIGMVLVVDSADVNSVCSGIVGEEASVIGKIEQSVGDDCHVEVNNFVSCMEMVMRPYVKEAIQVQMPLVRKRVGVLISGSGTNLQSLINHTTNSLKPSAAEIVLVISNKKDVEGLKRAERANIPTKVIPHGTFSSRAEFDAAVHAALVEAGVEIVCLAGFMRVLGSEFVRNWHGKLINIHPSLLPLFKGTHAHKQALEAGVRVTGCTVHFVVEDIDAGAIIYQESAPIEVGDTEETLQERVKLVEHKAFPKALELLARGKIYVDNSGKIVWKA